MAKYARDYPNGQVPLSILLEVDGVRMTRTTARDYKRMKKKHPTWRVFNSMSAYRSRYQQALLKADPKRWGSAMPSSMIASPGLSTHGWGDVVDMSIPPTALNLAKARFYRFSRPNPKTDPYHFRHR